MNPLRAYTVFCEYDRIEQSATDTLVAALPASIEMVIPDISEPILVHIHSYTRIEFENGSGPPDSCVVLLKYNDKVIFENVLQPSLMSVEFETTRSLGLTYVAFVARSVGHGLAIPTLDGKLEAVVVSDGTEFVSGVLNFRFKKQAGLNISNDPAKSESSRLMALPIS